MPITLSIIICTYNRKVLLKNCLDALIEQLPEFAQTTEVIVVDNNCVDGTAEMVRRLDNEYLWLKYLKEEKQGLSNARNCGAEHAQGEYLCYLDDDGRPSERYLFNLHKVLRTQRPDIAGGPIYPYYTTSRPDWFEDEFEIRKHAKASGYSEKCNISGGNFIIRASLLREVGMFSPHFGMVGNKTRLGEEKAVLLSYRGSRAVADQRVYYSMECFIYHHVPPDKMRIGYFIKRGFFSGRALVQLKKLSWKVFRASLKRVVVNALIELPVSFFRRNSVDSHPVTIIKDIFLDIGKISMVLQVKFRLIERNDMPK